MSLSELQSLPKSNTELSQRISRTKVLMSLLGAYAKRAAYFSFTLILSQQNRLLYGFWQCEGRRAKYCMYGTRSHKVLQPFAWLPGKPGSRIEDRGLRIEDEGSGIGDRLTKNNLTLVIVLTTSAPALDITFIM